MFFFFLRRERCAVWVLVSLGSDICYMGETLQASPLTCAGLPYQDLPARIRDALWRPVCRAGRLPLRQQVVRDQSSGGGDGARHRVPPAGRAEDGGADEHAQPTAPASARGVRRRRATMPMWSVGGRIMSAAGEATSSGCASVLSVHASSGSTSSADK